MFKVVKVIQQDSGLVYHSVVDDMGIMADGSYIKLAAIKRANFLNQLYAREKAEIKKQEMKLDRELSKK